MDPWLRAILCYIMIYIVNQNFYLNTHTLQHYSMVHGSLTIIKIVFKTTYLKQYQKLPWVNKLTHIWIIPPIMHTYAKNRYAVIAVLHIFISTILLPTHPSPTISMSQHCVPDWWLYDIASLLHTDATDCLKMHSCTWMSALLKYLLCINSNLAQLSNHRQKCWINQFITILRETDEI